MSITVPIRKRGKHMTVLNVVLACLLHARIQEFSPKGGGGGEGGPCPPDRKKLLCLKKNADSFTEGVRFFTSHQQSFSYVGTGLPELNQY